MGLIVALVALAVFARTTGFAFLVWDDDQHVAANPRFDPPTLESLASFWRAPFQGLYVPASYTLFWLEAVVTGGPRPWLYHGVSVLLHAANAVLVLVLLRRLGASMWGAAVGALLFAIHPLQVESVAWISEQRGLLAAAFGLGALVAWAHPVRSWRRDALSAAFLVLALLAKPSAAVVPAIALVLETFVLRRGWRNAAPRLAIGFAAAAACLLLTKSLQGDATVREVVAPAERLLVAADALEFYLRKLAWPLDLCADHGRRPSLVVAHGVDVTLVLTIVGLAALLLVPALRRITLVPLALFVVALAPVLGLVPFGHQDISTVADRYAYLALLGPAYLVARAWPERTGVPLRAGAVGVAGLLAALAFAQSAHWRDTEAVFERVLSVNARSWIAHTNLGLVLQARGDVAGAQREYEGAITVKPDHARALNNLGILLVQQDRAQEGEALVRRAAEADPRYARPHMNLAAILGNQGRFEDAEVSARRAVELAPDDAQMHTTLGNVLLRRGRAEPALREFEAASRLRARDVDAWLGMGLALEQLGRMPAARASFERARVVARQRAPGRVREIEAHIERTDRP